MEVAKRKYKKHKTESKISVRHYLNTKVKGKKGNGTIYFPLYIQITHKGKVNYVKSFLNTESTIENFDSFKRYRNQDLQEEIDFLTTRISTLSQELGENFTLKNLTGSNENIYTLIVRCLKSEIFDAVMLSDKEAKDSIIDEKTGLPLVEDSNSREYIEKIAEVSPLRHAINWDENPEEVLSGIIRLTKEIPKLLELKKDFLKDIHFFDLLFSSELHSNAEITLGSWQVGYAQAKLQRIYKDTDKEQMCKEYIENIDSLLRRHNEID